VTKETKPTATARLTPAEMELLQILWKRGPSSLSDVHGALERSLGYTTVQTRLNRLHSKGVVERSDDRPARYRALVAPRDVAAGDLKLLVKNVADGSVVPLVAQLVQDRRLSTEEITELKALIAAAEKRTNR
jgi:BlaI family transcriptional regulator, penicillinase repressor